MRQFAVSRVDRRPRGKYYWSSSSSNWRRFIDIRSIPAAGQAGRIGYICMLLGCRRGGWASESDRSRSCVHEQEVEEIQQCEFHAPKCGCQKFLWWVAASSIIGGEWWMRRSRLSARGRASSARRWTSDREIFGHNRLRSWGLQVQPVTCWNPPVFLYQIGVNSMNSSKMIGKFLAVLNFNRLFLHLNRFICN